MGSSAGWCDTCGPVLFLMTIVTQYCPSYLLVLFLMTIVTQYCPSYLLACSTRGGQSSSSAVYFTVSLFTVFTSDCNRGLFGGKSNDEEDLTKKEEPASKLHIQFFSFTTFYYLVCLRLTRLFTASVYMRFSSLSGSPDITVPVDWA